MPAELPAVLLLDLDDTILDDTGARDRCWQTTCTEAAERFPGLDPVTLRVEIESVRDWFWSDPGRHETGRLSMPEAWKAIVTDALARLEIHDPVLAAFVADRHTELRSAAITPLAGAVETLEGLRAHGVVLGLVTNGASDAQRAKIERFGLAGHFDYIGIEGEVGIGKPHPAAYESALRVLEASPKTTWMVGDNLEWDVAGAQAVGILGIWVDRDGNGVPSGSTIAPDRIIRALAELAPSR